MSMLISENKLLLNVIKASLWSNSIDEQIYDNTLLEMKQHAIVALPFSDISKFNMSPELTEKWKKEALSQISYSIMYQHAQKNLPITVPYVILKGSTAAQYYPNPSLRTMGDIDIMTKQSDYQCACEMLLRNGYIENTPKTSEILGRHRCFYKSGIEVEVHAFFSLLNDPNKAEYMDNLIRANINPSHILPDLINGLVILEHINQHLEDGIGLRQIIDWMMFVDKCLTDEKWPEFSNLVIKLGLKNLAIIITRMCEMYLGLSKHKWCDDVDVDLCDQLMEYIIHCGNFGNKMISDKDISEKVFAYAISPKVLFRHLQYRGLKNWKLTKKYRTLRPFSWLYQICRYVKRGTNRRQAITKIREEYMAGKKRRRLFEVLGVTTIAKDIYVYKNGEYIKTKINH